MAGRPLGASLPSEISSGSFPPLAGSLCLAAPQKEVGFSYAVDSRVTNGERRGPAPWGQGVGGRGWKGKEPGLRVASGFKQLCLEIEENLSGKWEGSGRTPRAEEQPVPANW